MKISMKYEVGSMKWGGITLGPLTLSLLLSSFILHPSYFSE